MFRKLIAHLSFSPSLIGALGSYGRGLRREEVVRCAGLIVTILALIVQVLVMLKPPESANAASSNDIAYGGVATTEELLAKYDRNEQNLRSFFTALGITRAELATMRDGSFNFASNSYVAGRDSFVSYRDGERPYRFETPGGTSTVYFAPSRLVGATTTGRQMTQPALLGTSNTRGSFAIIKSSGNLALPTVPGQPRSDTCAFRQQITTTDMLCQPCPNAPSVWVKSADCKTPIVYTKTATNNTQNRPATDTTAQASDRITYTLQARNVGTTAITVPLTDQIGDVLEYADVIDTGGGTLDLGAKTLSWPDASLAAGNTLTRTFSVRLKPHLPATAQGSSNPRSYDCVISNTSGTTVDINVACPATKTIETIAAGLPTIGSTLGALAGGSFLLAVVYFYIRARQQREEIRLIRKDFNSGSLSS